MYSVPISYIPVRCSHSQTPPVLDINTPHGTPINPWSRPNVARATCLCGWHNSWAKILTQTDSLRYAEGNFSGGVYIATPCMGERDSLAHTMDKAVNWGSIGGCSAFHSRVVACYYSASSVLCLVLPFPNPPNYSMGWQSLLVLMLLNAAAAPPGWYPSPQGPTSWSGQPPRQTRTHGVMLAANNP